MLDSLYVDILNSFGLLLQWRTQTTSTYWCREVFPVQAPWAPKIVKFFPSFYEIVQADQLITLVYVTNSVLKPQRIQNHQLTARLSHPTTGAHILSKWEQIPAVAIICGCISQAYFRLCRPWNSVQRWESRGCGHTGADVLQDRDAGLLWLFLGKIYVIFWFPWCSVLL